jgi:hypothetical protein
MPQAVTLADLAAVTDMLFQLPSADFEQMCCQEVPM